MSKVTGFLMGIVFLLWLVGINQKVAISEVASNLRSAAGSAKSQASSAASNARSKAKSAANQAENKARSVAQEAEQRIEKAVDKAEQEIIEIEKAAIGVVEQEAEKEIAEVRQEVGSLQEETAYNVIGVIGPAQARRQGGLVWIPLSKGIVLRAGSAIKTGPGGEVVIDIYKKGSKAGSQKITENREVELSK